LYYYYPAVFFSRVTRFASLSVSYALQTQKQKKNLDETELVRMFLATVLAKFSVLNSQKSRLFDVKNLNKLLHICIGLHAYLRVAAQAPSDLGADCKCKLSLLRLCNDQIYS